MRGRGRAAAPHAALALVALAGACAGPPGPAGERGPAAYVDGYTVVSQEFEVTLDPQAPTTVVATCPPETVVIGGGWELAPGSPPVAPRASAPTADGRGWRLELPAGPGVLCHGDVHALCARVAARD